MVNKEISSKLAEEGIISSLIYKPDKMVEIFDKLNPNVFYSKELGNIYRSMYELYKEDVIPDEVTIVNKACSLGFDISPEYVKKLANSTTFVTKKQLMQYIRIIQGSAFKRKTIDLCSDFLENAKDISDPDKIINDFFNLAIDLSDKVKNQNNTSSIDIDEKSVLDYLDDRYNNPDVITGIPFGFPTIDHYLDGAEAGNIITIGGQNSHGKSYFAQCSAINMARWLVRNNYDRKILFISLEMTRQQMEWRFLSILTGINSKYFKNPKDFFIDRKVQPTEENFKQFKEYVAKAIKTLNSLPIVIDDSSSLSGNQIVGMIKKQHLKNGVACVFIDYVGLVVNDGYEDYMNICQTYKILKQTAKDIKIPIIILNQYNKDFKGREKSGYKPRMDDMTGGKGAMNDSHKIIHVWKPDKYGDFIEKHPEYIGKIVVFSDKNRDGAYGDMPEVLLQFSNGQLKEERDIMKEINTITESEEDEV